MPDVPNPMNPYSGHNDDESNDGLEEMLRGILGGEPDPSMMEALRGMGMGQMDPAALGMMQAQFQAMMSGNSGSPFNLQLATDVARRTVATEGDPSVPESTQHDIQQVVQVANLWLDQATDFAAPHAPAKGLSRSEWIEATMPTWRAIVEPVATGVGNAIAEAMTKQLGQMDSHDLEAMGIPEGMLPAGFDASQLSAQMGPMMKQMSSTMFGMQVGEAIGALAGDTVSGTEVGIPLLNPAAIALLPNNVAAFAEGLGIDAGEVNLYLAVREAARVRLFASVGWLGPAIIAAVQSYAGDIRIDTDAIEEKLREVDPSDAEAMQAALGNNLFAASPSPEQTRALEHLETLLALTEGWVDTVAAEAVGSHLPQASALGEAVRRRRATGGPAERTFSSLIGLELRPRRLREAAALWEKFSAEAGAQARDEAWSHPDFAPTSEDLNDPSAYIARRTGSEVAEQAPDEMDDELAKLLAQGTAEFEAEKGAASEPAKPTDDATEVENKGDSDGDSAPKDSE